jgi:hypothetical protein
MIVIGVRSFATRIRRSAVSTAHGAPRLIASIAAITGCAVVSAGCGTSSSTKPRSSATGASATASTASGPRHMTAAPPPGCRSRALALALRSEGGAAGTEFYLVILRNRSSKACVLEGFPGVSLLDRKHHQLGSAAQREGAPGARFSVKPGRAGSATFTVSGGACPNPGFSAYIRVFPPNATVALSKPAHVIVCAPKIKPLRSGTAPSSATGG